ncbi:MAG: ABC transporter ATP-binding protein [Dehalococcoidales bacterium]|nr:ABC transporter ATP-binding protein [Dehalococcoidales bacterium]
MSQGQMGSPQYAVEAAGLSVVLGGHKVLEIPSLQVNPNEVLVVIGPNGSGKSTLLLCLALLLKPATGTITYKGIPILSSNQVLQLHRRLSVVFQEPLLLNSTVWDNVTLGLRLRGIKKDEVAARAEKWLERFGIAPLAKRQARKLSGGEAKRVSLARAFVLQPEVLFLDEPFNALDSPTRQALLEDFESVLRETKVTTVMVTHDRNEALVLADRVAVLMNGSIRQLGTPEEVFGSPSDEELAAFVEAGNILHGTVVSQSNGVTTIAVGGRQIQAVANAAIGTRVTVYLHYEDVTINLPLAEPVLTSARNQLRGTIVKMFPFASQIKVTIDCGFALASVITRRSWEELGLGLGREVVASFKASSVHLILRPE